MIIAVFSLFNLATGEIVGTVTCPDVDVEANTPTGFGRVPGEWNGETHFISAGEVHQRQAFEFTDREIAADDADTATFVLPVSPVTLTIDGTAHEVTGPVAEFTAETPGVYSLTFSGFPYLEQTVTVHAV